MTRPQPEIPAVETTSPSSGSPGPIAGDDAEPETRAGDGDTKHSTDPKGGLGAKPKKRARRLDGGGTDTGGGGGSKTGLGTKPKTGRGAPAAHPSRQAPTAKR